MDLLRLQSLCKTHPEAYEDNFIQQFTKFSSLIELFKITPNDEHETLVELIHFISHTAPRYPQHTAHVPQLFCDLLDTYANLCRPEVRIAMINSVILFRSKGILDPTTVIPLFFRLFAINDKEAKKTLHNHIVSDIRAINRSGSKKNSVSKSANSTIQNFLFDILRADDYTMAKRSLDVCIELFNKNIWDNDRVVNAMVYAIFHRDSRLSEAICKFFVANDIKSVEDKQTSALLMINDAHTLCDKLISYTATNKSLKWKHRVLLCDFLGRLIGAQQVQNFDFFDYVQKFLSPSMDSVTSLLASCVSATHPLIPPDFLIGMVRHIANNFISDLNRNSAIVVGLNTIRNILQRQPALANEDKDLFSDLSRYVNQKGDRGVSTSARSLVHLLREVCPEALHRRDRGKEASVLLNRGLFENYQFGKDQAASGLVGAQLLEAVEAGELDLSDKVDADGDDVDDGWSEVPDEGIELSSDWEEVDFDDDDLAAKKEWQEKAKALLEAQKGQDTVPLDQIKLFDDSDFEKMKELEERLGESLAQKLQAENVTAAELLKFLRRGKLTRNEKIAMHKAGTENEVHKRKQKKALTGTLTNREKRASKNFMMVKHKISKQQSKLKSSQKRKSGKKK